MPKEPPEIDEEKREAYERYMVRKVFEEHFGIGRESHDVPFDVSHEARNDEWRIERGYHPLYGNVRKYMRLKDFEGTPAPTAITPKIYTGGNGSNRDPPTAGAATVQRMRETADAERKNRETLFIELRN